MRLWLGVVLILAAVCRSYKIAIFAPDMPSQALFYKRIGDELSRAGHDVTLYSMHIFNRAYTGPSKYADSSYRGMLTRDPPFWDEGERKLMANMKHMYKACEMLVQNRELIAEIESAKYDLAFAHMYNFCPMGVIHKAGIPTWIWVSSGSLFEIIATAMGVPTPPSYVAPLLMDAGDRLSFVQRVKSFTGHLLFQILVKRIAADGETEVFRREFGEDFPDLTDLSRKTPLVMVNSNDLYDFPRPSLAKVINIGGLGMTVEDAKNLTGQFAHRVDRGKGHIVFTFGSIISMKHMPYEWKDAYFKAFAQFPDIEFFIRYEKPEEIQERLPRNVYASSWLPQRDLLQHSKALVLITHGGYNSFQDALHAGVPLIATGLFADQFRTAHLVEKLGVGINLRRTDITQENVAAAIRRMIDDQSLMESARRLQDMIRKQPVRPEHLLVRWTEFLAEYKNLDNLVPAGNDLNIFVYHSIDVIAFLIFVVLTLLTISFFGTLWCIRKICSRTKAKIE